MANNPLPLNTPSLETSLELTEVIQSPRFRAGGPSSSGLLNRLIQRLKNDISRLASDVTDASDQTRLLALVLGGLNSGTGRMFNALKTQVDALAAANPGPTGGKALADFFLGANVVSDSNVTTVDINPLFGQATLPARSRQNCLVVETSDGEPPRICDATSLQFCIQPDQTSTLGVTAPPDYLFAEDPNSPYALDNLDITPWIIEDTTTTPHVCWLDIYLPGGASGSYRCNELELVPNPQFAFDVISVQAEVVGQGWQNVDFSYITGYDSSTKAIIGIPPMRLCFPQTSVLRFRIGLWCSGSWGFQSIRVLNASYASSASLTVDFSSYSPGAAFDTITLYGKNPSQLSTLAISPSLTQVTVTVTPSASSAETPVITGVQATW